ncbi:hypothetical protein GCM10008927_01070 [Amylibacter ulvae]|uniref:Uncharacterized protein n=2 Tax=Paramylibacter ulvae TaxID=1651968 RepID=A0ABQ3CSM5_9RHOB|nr:hypothetical protein GCM10008927_01070 [Amylibacter ulvae]
MGRLIKYLFYLAILVALCLVGYSFFGDLSAPSVNHTETIELETQ